MTNECSNVNPEEYFCTCGCHGRHTFDAIMNVFVWSINLLFHGLWPSARHDDSPFMHNRGSSVLGGRDGHKRGFSVSGGEAMCRDNRGFSVSDTWRAKRAREALGCKAVLQQCRGDWMWYKELFSFPSWASSQMCWLCKASQHGPCAYKQFGSGAGWRKNRYKVGEFFVRQANEGLQPSPLFDAIGFKLAMVMIDVLHCMDLGCSQDILGNIFWEALPWCCKGRSRKAQAENLWEKICEYYAEFDPSTKLQGFTLEMIKQPKKSPKLRAKGAETRHLVAFGVLLAIELHERRNDTHSLVVVKVANYLFELYCLFAQRPVDARTIGTTCRQLCLLYSSLQPEGDDSVWRVKPKFHMLAELCEYQVDQFGSPEEFWAYKDESFVGFVAEFSHRRGGAANATSICQAVLNRYSALSSLD